MSILGEGDRIDLELGELLSGVDFTLALNLKDVEANGFGQGAAFTDGDDITSLDTNEGGRAVRSKVLVSLLVTVVLLDVVQVFTTDNDGAFHFSGHDLTGKNTTTDGDVTSEGALLINVGTRDGFLGSLETQTDILVPAGTFTLGDDALVVHEDGVLLLESFMSLETRIKGEERGDQNDKIIVKNLK